MILATGDSGSLFVSAFVLVVLAGTTWWLHEGKGGR